MVSLMQNEGKTDNRKAITIFLSDNFSASSRSNMQISIARLTYQNTVHLKLRFNLGLTHQIWEVKLNSV